MEKHIHVMAWIVLPILVGGVLGFHFLKCLPEYVVSFVFFFVLVGLSTLPFMTPKSSRVMKGVVFLLLLNVGSLIGGLTRLL